MDLGGELLFSIDEKQAYDDATQETLGRGVAAYGISSSAFQDILKELRSSSNGLNAPSAFPPQKAGHYLHMVVRMRQLIHFLSRDKVLYIARKIVRVRIESRAPFPMAPIIAENGEEATEYAAAVMNKGAVPVVLQRIPIGETGFRSAGQKDVWAKVVNNVVNIYFKADTSEEFHTKVREYIGALKGYGNVQGSPLLLKVIEEMSGKKIDVRKLMVVDMVGMAFPAWQNIPVIRNKEIVAWPIADSVTYAECVAASPEKGFMSRWSNAFKKISRYNQSLFFTVDDIKKAGAANIKLLMNKGAHVYMVDDRRTRTDRDEREVIEIIKSYGLAGIVYTDPDAHVPQALINRTDIVVAGAHDAGHMRHYVSINLDEIGADQLNTIPAGSVVHVHLGKNGNNQERINKLNTLSPSVILMFDSEEFKQSSMSQDILDIMFYGVDWLSGLELTPRTPAERKEVQRKVAYLLELVDFEKYATEDELLTEIVRVASSQNIPFTKNKHFFEAVRLHFNNVSEFDQKLFLDAVTERLRALTVADKRGNLENREVEMILGAMVARNNTYPTDQHMAPQQSVLDTFANRSRDTGVTPAQFQLELYFEIKNQEHIVEQTSNQSQAQAVSTIIELVKLYAGERILTSVTREDFSPVKVDSIKAILDAG
ncbi:MAG: hypothetical protein ABSH12_03995 [Endomicrobiales bacterium]